MYSTLVPLTCKFLGLTSNGMLKIWLSLDRQEVNMSKLKVKVTNPTNGQFRLVELEARAPSLSRVDAEARRKFGVNSNIQLLYRQQNGTHIPVQSDAELQKACLECYQYKRPFVDLELSGPGAYQAAQASQASQQQQYHQPAAQQQYHQPAQSSYDPGAQASNRSQGTSRPAAAQASNLQASGSSLVQAIHVRGAPGAPEKMKVVARQEDDRYVFVPEPASTDTLVEVELPSIRQLVFKLTSERSKLNQIFNMPFDVNPKNLQVNGTNVEYMFDW